jgi:hypothetical protein
MAMAIAALTTMVGGPWGMSGIGVTLGVLVMPGVLEVEEEVLVVLDELEVRVEVPLKPGELVVEEEADKLAVLVSPGELVLRGEVTRLSSREGELGSECVTGFATAKCIVICSSIVRI